MCSSEFSYCNHDFRQKCFLCTREDGKFHRRHTKKVHNLGLTMCRTKETSIKDDYVITPSGITMCIFQPSAGNIVPLESDENEKSVVIIITDHYLDYGSNHMTTIECVVDDTPSTLVNMDFTERRTHLSRSYFFLRGIQM
jgi:hypothetical protein